jgi:hypothetical protein
MEWDRVAARTGAEGRASREMDGTAHEVGG